MAGETQMWLSSERTTVRRKSKGVGILKECFARQKHYVHSVDNPLYVHSVNNPIIMYYCRWHIQEQMWYHSSNHKPSHTNQTPSNLTFDSLKARTHRPDL